MKARHILASLALLSCAAQAHATSRIFAVATETPRNPAMLLSDQPCQAPGYEHILRSFVAAGEGRTAEACWTLTPGDDVILCRLKISNNRNSSMTPRCWSLPMGRYKPITMPRH